MSAAVSRPVLRYRSGGLNSLLDSTSLDEWKPPAAGGRWHFDQDDDRATVLAGTGFTRRAFIAPEDYRITFGLDLHDADAAEVHFGLRAGGQRYVLRVTKDGAVFGAKDGDKTAFRPLGSLVPFPSKKSFGDRRPYLEVQAERAGGWWTARFNGADAGRIADDGSPKLPEVRLYAEGGSARVDSVILEPLERAE